MEYAVLRQLLLLHFFHKLHLTLVFASQDKYTSFEGCYDNILMSMIIIFTEWSKGVWDSDFTEIDTIDDTIVEELNWSEIIPTLYRLGKVLDHWVKNESEEGWYEF